MNYFWLGVRRDITFDFRKMGRIWNRKKWERKITLLLALKCENMGMYNKQKVELGGHYNGRL